MSAAELLAEALRLPRPQRAQVVEQLLSSLEEAEDEIATAWASELERRSAEAANRLVELTPLETVRSSLMKELDRRRADRISS